MREKKFLISVLGMLMLGFSLFAEEKAPNETIPKKEMNSFQKFEAVRLIGSVTPGDVLKDWMTAGALKKFNEEYVGLTMPDGSSPILMDFFSYALIFKGSQNDLSGIYAFYNPFQDNLLLIQTDNVDRIPRIEDFVFLTGSDFRGEKLQQNEYPQAIAPTREMIDVVLLKNTALVSEIFHREFPAGAAAISLRKYRNKSDSFEKIIFNAQLRLALLEKFTIPESKNAAELAGEVVLQLWESDLSGLKKFFRFSTEDFTPAETYCLLPARVRASMLPVFYFQSKKEVMLCFASRFLPELVVLIKTDQGKKDKPLFVVLPLNERFCREIVSEVK